MANNLNDEQFENVCENIVVKNDGSTNKKCPLCGNDVIVIFKNSSYNIRCKTEGCFSEVGRGI